jgi:hypothetical protein
MVYDRRSVIGLLFLDSSLILRVAQYRIDSSVCPRSGPAHRSVFRSASESAAHY